MRSNWLQWDWSFPGVFFEKEFYLFRAVSLSIGSVASGHKPPAEASSAFETTGRENSDPYGAPLPIGLLRGLRRLPCDNGSPNEILELKD